MGVYLAGLAMRFFPFAKAHSDKQSEGENQ